MVLTFFDMLFEKEFFLRQAGTDDEAELSSTSVICL